MKAKITLNVMLCLAVAAASAYALYASLYWPFRTALFPRVIGIPLFFLAMAEMALSLRPSEKKEPGQAIDFQFTTDIDPALARRRTVMIFSWILGFLLLILLVGFPLAVPLFVFLYLKVAGEGWLLSGVMTALSWLFMEGLFDWLLHLPFAQGWLFSLWG